MKLVHWARGLLVWGLLAALVSFAPALLLSIAPATWSDGFFGTLAALLSLTVTPFAIVVASVGAILLLVAVLRRGQLLGSSLGVRTIRFDHSSHAMSCD